MKLIDLLITVANQHLAEFQRIPKAPARPGHNGPYHDCETPVRNSAHWLIILCRLYSITGSEGYRRRAEFLLDYLLSQEARPHGYSFRLRDQEGKDSCNGVIGAAWVFEALNQAAGDLKKPTLSDVAEEVFFQHRFNDALGLWHRLEIDGRMLPEDPTFNHQLWFAACSADIRGIQHDSVLKRVSIFLDHLDQTLTTLPAGTIYHPIERFQEAHLARIFSLTRRSREAMHNWVTSLARLRLPEKRRGEKKTRAAVREKNMTKSVGYHAFNMYAFAMLKSELPEHEFWNTERFHDAVDYMMTEQYHQDLDQNPYGYPYNPPGFEVPFAPAHLKEMPEDDLIDWTRRWTQEQIDRCYNPQTARMDRNTEDPETHTARLYELAKFPDDLLQNVDIKTPRPEA